MVAGLHGSSVVKNLPTNAVKSLIQEDALEKEMANHSSIPAWEIPRMEEAGGLQSMGSQRVGHDLMTKLKEEAWQKEGNHPPTMTRLPVQERLLDQVQKATHEYGNRVQPAADDRLSYPVVKPGDWVLL